MGRSEITNSAGWRGGMPWFAIAAAAFAVEIPFLFHHGLPSGHDVEFHLYSWLEVLGQWKQGVVYPRWAAMAQFGYGEPRFIFYPPVSWTLGAGLSAVLPWVLAPAAYIWLALMAAGSTMYLLARRLMSRTDAIFAAVLYAVNPYHLVIVYWRSALAELLAGCLLPLLVLSVLRAWEGQRHATLGMATVLAAGWLVNVPAAVMMQYSFGLMIVVAVWVGRAPKLLFRAALAVAVGAGLAAFYLVPAASEQKWVDIQELTTGGYGPQDNFLFARTSDAEHDEFGRLVSVVACAEIGVTLAGLVLAGAFRRKRHGEWWIVGVWMAAASLLMWRGSAWIWEVAPQMRFMQFPWRWLLALGAGMALLVAVGMKRWSVRAAVCMAMLGVVVFAWQKMQSPWWDGPKDLQEMQDNMESRAGYEGSDEYRPSGADAEAVDKGARKATMEGAARGEIRVQRWEAEEREFTVDMRQDGGVALKLFAYPAWRVEVNGRVVVPETKANGQMLVPLEAGMSRVSVRLEKTRDRKLGGWISFGSMLLVGVMLVRGWKRG